MLEFQPEAFQNQVLCYRRVTKGGELESLSPSAFHPATTVGVCLPLDPLTHKGLKRGEASDRTHASHTQPWLGFLYIYIHTHTEREVPARTHVHIEDKLCIKIPADVHNMDKTYVSFKRADYKSTQNLAQMWQIKATDVVFPPVLNMSAWFVEKVSPLAFVLARLM